MCSGAGGVESSDGVICYIIVFQGGRGVLTLATTTQCAVAAGAVLAWDKALVRGAGDARS